MVTLASQHRGKADCRKTAFSHRLTKIIVEEPDCFTRISIEIYDYRGFSDPGRTDYIEVDRISTTPLHTHQLASEFWELVNLPNDRGVGV
jgi:hypothetical protein